MNEYGTMVIYLRKYTKTSTSVHYTYMCTWHLVDGRRVLVHYTSGKHTRYQHHSADKRPYGNDMCSERRQSLIYYSFSKIFIEIQFNKRTSFAVFRIIPISWINKGGSRNAFGEGQPTFFQSNFVLNSSKMEITRQSL